MKINPVVYGIAVVALFLGIIGGFRAAGVWSVSGKVSASGEKISADGADVASIKGWMTVGEIAQAFDVPLAELLAHFELPADTGPSTPVKDLESETFEVTGLREWLAKRQAGIDQAR